MVETDLNKRWEEGIPHHPKSEELFKAIAEIDYKYNSDFFCWKSGGDGDNGEILMYLMDVYFEEKDEQNDDSILKIIHDHKDLGDLSQDLIDFYTEYQIADDIKKHNDEEG